MDTMNSKEAAEYLAVTEHSLRSMRCDGLGPPFHREGRAVRYRVDDLRAYVERLDAAGQARRRNRIERMKERGALADRRGRP